MKIKQPRGMTLIEVMIAMAIVSILAVGIADTPLSGGQVTLEDKSRALNILRSAVAWVHRRPGAAFVAGQHSALDDSRALSLDEAAQIEGIALLPNAKLAVSVSPIGESPDFIAVEVQLTWKRRAGVPMERRLSTIVRRGTP